MGLDMYLHKRTYIGNKHRDAKKRVKLVVPKDVDAMASGAKEIKTERISEIIEDVGYWRKANQIHQWFVDNVQDGVDNCGDYFVSKEQLTELLDLCKRVYAASELVDGKIKNGYTYEGGKEVPIMVDGKYIKDPSVAQELLPAQEGFFFGGTEYDEYYLQDIKETIDMLEELLKESERGDFYYHSSW